MSYTDQKENLNKTVWRLVPNAPSVLSDDPDFLIEEVSEVFNLTMGEIGELCELVRQVITKELPVEKFGEGLKEKLDEENRSRVGEIVWEVNDKVFVKLLPVLGMKALPIVARPAAPVAPVTEPATTPEVTKTRPSDGPTSSSQTAPVFQTTKSSQLKTALPVPPRTVPLSTNNYQLKTVSNPYRLPTAPPTFAAPVSQLSSPLPTPKPSTVDYQPPTNTVTPTPIIPKPRPQFIAPKLSSPVSTRANFSPSKPASPVPIRIQTPSNSTPNPRPSLVEPSHKSLSENPTDSFLKMLSGKLSEKELQTRFDKLPYALKTALRSVDSARVVVDIGRKYALHVDKLGELGEETGLVILGITHPGEFLGRLSRKLGVSEDKTRLIAQEINTEILLKIRDALKQVNGEPILARQPSTESSTKREMQQQNPSTNKGSTFVKKEREEIPSRESLLKDIEDPALPQEYESMPNRDSLLRDIENPTPTNYTPMRSQSMSYAPEPPRDIPPPVPQIAEEAPEPVAQAQTVVTPVQVTPIKTRPTEVAPEPTSTTPDTPKNIVDQKLSNTVVSPKSQSSYSSDPYREPLS
ncbi:MAG: hypothetical protein AAB511_01065 [Patescibacteria group bacterium]